MCFLPAPRRFEAGQFLPDPIDGFSTTGNLLLMSYVLVGAEGAL